MYIICMYCNLPLDEVWLWGSPPHGLYENLSVFSWSEQGSNWNVGNGFRHSYIRQFSRFQALCHMWFAGFNLFWHSGQCIHFSKESNSNNHEIWFSDGFQKGHFMEPDFRMWARSWGSCWSRNGIKKQSIVVSKKIQQIRHLFEGNFSEFHTFAIDILYQNV